MASMYHALFVFLNQLRRTESRRPNAKLRSIPSSFPTKITWLTMKIYELFTDILTKHSVLNYPQAHCCIATVPSLVTPVRRPNYFSARLYTITTDNGFLPCLDSDEQPKCNLIVTYISLLPWSDRRVIKKLHHKTKGGPDYIPQSFFLNFCDKLCYLLSQFFTISFEHSILPPAWLTVFITPLFRRGKSVDANNYHPTALTCTMCKLMEAFIEDQMVQFLVDKGLINKH
jgi:hypothetical protein